MTTLLGAVAANGDRPALPAAARGRWQPIRGGLLNLYRYDHEEFRYEQGRLLLRGNNGTGKSRVLALQLPFLLDGDVSPHRLEPDGDPAKRIEWNLLLGTHDERLGYTWLEFGRREDGDDRYVTLGCGLHAVAGRGLAARWFFVTDQRVGEELFLQRPDGTAVTRDRLVEALGDRGEVFPTAAAYRAHVDRALFGLGEHRYAALVNLLVQLRQPQLSRQLDEQRLSTALSEALPPVSDAIIGDVAEALRSLENDQVALDAFESARAGAEAFLVEYRRYTQILARRRAQAVRSRHGEYETTMRKLRVAEAEQAEAVEALRAATGRLETLSGDERAAQAAVDTLADSPRMQDARALDRARRDADDRRTEAESAAAERDRAAAARADRDDERDAAEQAAAGSREGVAATARETVDASVTAGVGALHEQAVAPLSLPDGPDDDALIGRAAAGCGDVAAGRRRAVRHVTALADGVAAAATELRVAKSSHDSLSAQLDEALENQQAAADGLAAAVTDLAAAYRVWAAGTRELLPADADDVAWELDHWSSSGQGASPVATAVRDAVTTATGRIAAARSGARARLGATEEGLASLTDERDRLAAGRHSPPPSPHTRDADARAARAGAPLWQLVDFSDGLDEGAHAGLEAACEGAGLLDAWVTPDGTLLAERDLDTVLVAGDGPAADRNLAEVLVADADADAGVPAGVLDGVLARIGLGTGTAALAVDVDGTWAAGPLHGRWAKPAAEHIGAAAREAARHRRLAALTAQIAEAQRARDAVIAELDGLAAAEGALADEAAAAPDDAPVRSALAGIAAAADAVHGLRGRVADAEARVADHRARHDAAVAERDSAARDVGVEDWFDDLPGLLDAVGAYERAAAGLWPTLRAHLDARRQAAAARARAADAAAGESRLAEQARQAQGRAQAAAAERDTLAARVGAGVEEILAELAAARDRVAKVRADREAARGASATAQTARAVAEHDITQLGTALEADAGRRQDAVDALVGYVATGLLAVARDEFEELDTGDGEWSIDRAVRLARRVEQALSDVDSDDLAWQRIQKGIHGHLQTLIDTLLPHGYEPSPTLVDEVLVVTVPFQGRNCSMTQLRAALADEVAHRRSLLDAREREVLENHLIGEVSAHLHDLLRAGEEWVAEVNDELAAAPTSTGMTLRFVWRPVDEGPLHEARRRLLRPGGTWSPAERDALGAFLQARIAAVRAENDTGTWQEHLAAALDYRQWHTFDVERRQDGQWKRLTRRTHGTGSGGEKAIALTVPQFAAAAAHYRSAAPGAPRLILLDEAFVGVDADMRAKCMGLLTAFDLDFVMTSEREWGCYATLPGVAIYQLATRPGIDAVGVTRWVWNGRERRRDDTRPPPAHPPEPAQPSQSPRPQPAHPPEPPGLGL